MLHCRMFGIPNILTGARRHSGLPSLYFTEYNERQSKSPVSVGIYAA